MARFAADLDGGDHRVSLWIEDREDQRLAVYPIIAAPRWPLAVGAAVLALVALLVWLLRWPRSLGQLVFLEGARKGQVLRLRRGVLRVGSLADNDLVIPSPAVSRYHAELHVQRRRIEIRDLHSSNGTEVNGKPVQSSLLHPGDTIRLADVALVLER